MACPPGMRGCAVTCGHRQFVEGYRQERERQEIVAENVSLGYDTEYAEYVADHPLPTFKQWLKQSKGPEMTESTERWSWTKEEQPAEVARVEELQTADRRAEAAIEKAEMDRYQAVDVEPPTLRQVRDYNETGLLGAAMVSDEALPALRTVCNEFTDVFHENVAKAILDQAADGAPHDAAAVEAVLRERKVYALPEVPAPAKDLRPYGPYYPNLPPGQEQPNKQWEAEPPEIPSQLPVGAEYGLGAWQNGANPADANALAQAVRQDTRARYLEGVGTRLQQSALAAAEAGEDPGLAFARSANELVSVPPRLDLDLREIKNTASLDAVDTTRPVRVVRAATEATTPHLGLPARPQTAHLKALASA